ncbi:MAG: hypothetical protein J6T55_03195 [Alphaproteobacteria bacterium]|nr:hypothetical protein [Alphaproteobacteria bacterium]
MISENLMENVITKNDLLRDYVSFLLVIFLSFFFKYTTKELVESIWFYSVVLVDSMLLYQLIKCFEYDNFSSARLVSIIGTGFLYTALYIAQIKGVFMIMGFDENAFNIKNFIFYLPFVPFVLFQNRKYFKEFLWKDKINKVSWIVFLTFLKICILIALIYNFRQNETLAFYVIYALFFFPFLKTFKFLMQKRGAK